MVALSGETPMATTTLFERMRKDHRSVLEHVARLERGALAKTRTARARSGEHDRELRALIAMLERQFATHMAAEDQVLYPQLTQVLPQCEAAVAPLRAEHDELRAMLHRLAKTLREPPGPTRDEQIAVQARDLIDLLRLHIRKEESIVLSVAERVLTPLEIDALEARIRTIVPAAAKRRGSGVPRQGGRT
jgi:hemerythrin-like domain-containing protein